MRKIASFVGIALALLVIAGCSSPIGSNDGNTGFELEPGFAKVVIPLPNTGNARGVGLTESKANANYYQVTFHRTDAGYTSQYYSASATTAAGQIALAFPAGTYEAVLFAGYKAGSSQYPILLASSHVTDKVITMAGPNIINMELALVDFTFSAADTAEAGSSIPVTVTANLPSSVGNLSLIDSQGDPIPAPSKVGTAYTWSYTRTAPNTPGIIYIYLSGACYPFSSSSGGNQWYFASTSPTYLGTSTLADHYRKAITVGSPDIGIVITWPDE